MGRSWGFIKCRWVTIRCPVNLFCPTQCGGSVSLLMGRMMTQLMPSWRGLTQHKQPRLNWCHQGGGLAQTQTAKTQLMLSRYVDSPNTSSQTRSDHGEITDIVCGLDMNDKWILFCETNNCVLWHLCSSHHQWPKSASISLPPHCWLAKLHFILWTAQMPSNCQFVGYPMPGIYSFSAQISAYFILFCFFKNCPQSKLFGG